MQERYSTSVSGEDSVTQETDGKIDIFCHGPALGIGYSMSFSRIYFITANLSGLYMLGEIKVKEEYSRYEGSNPRVFSSYTLIDDKSRHIGLNFEPSIGVSLDNRVLLTLGGRYQWFRVKIDTDIEEAQGWLNDHLYGLFVNVLFVF